MRTDFSRECVKIALLIQRSSLQECVVGKWTSTRKSKYLVAFIHSQNVSKEIVDFILYVGAIQVLLDENHGFTVSGCDFFSIIKPCAKGRSGRKSGYVLKRLDISLS